MTWFITPLHLGNLQHGSHHMLACSQNELTNGDYQLQPTQAYGNSANQDDSPQGQELIRLSPIVPYLLELLGSLTYAIVL